MDAKEQKIVRQLISAAEEAGQDYHGEKYWDLFHERQQLTLRMLAILLGETLKK